MWIDFHNSNVKHTEFFADIFHFHNKGILFGETKMINDNINDDNINDNSEYHYCLALTLPSLIFSSRDLKLIHPALLQICYIILYISHFLICPWNREE